MKDEKLLELIKEELISLVRKWYDIISTILDNETYWRIQSGH